MKTSSPHPTSLLQGARRGFTLIEILIVVTILALLLSLTANISQGVVDSMNFRQAIQNVKARLESARQTAITTNRSVMVRILRGENEFGNKVWNGLQIGSAEIITDPAAPGYEVPVGGSYTPTFKAVDPAERLPLGFIFHESSTYSTLLSSLPGITHGSTTHAGGVTEDYASFVFLPDGRCALPTGTDWTLTIIQEEDASNGALPPDYVTLQLDPRTARTRVYRR